MKSCIALLLMAQCNALHTSMPFLFDRIGGKTELLLPANLLHTDSLIRKLTRGTRRERMGAHRSHRMALPVLYFREEGTGHTQGGGLKRHTSGHTAFYAQLDREVFGTKLIGCSQWLATYPYSRIKKQMYYYIEPAEQTDEVAAQLKEITL